MAKRQKTKAFSIQGFDAAHYKTTEAYARAVGNLFDRATNDVAMGVSKLNVDPNKPFQFCDYPSAQATMKRVANKLAKSITAVVADGSRKQWLFACKKDDEFVASIMDTSKLSKARLNKMQDRNLDSLKSFQDRKVDGMNLSQRVWKYTEQFKAQIEAGLDVGLGEGRSAQELSRDLRQNLKEPNRLFRRVRDKRGNLQLSKNAQAFHPGQGVYRSSYKNAMRLTRSEINMAYREADWLRWQQLDFVIGFEIHRSNHEPKCKCSLCENLKGRYPKTFKFKGWHPQCRCYVTPILTTDDEFDAQELSDLKAALHGTEREQLATKLPEYDGMKALEQWAKENEEAQANWGSTPYFIKDNFNGGLLSNGLKAETIKAVETPKIDPIQQQLDQLQPSIAAIKQMASEWGFDTSPVDNALANRNPQGVINAISEIRNRINNAMNELKSFIEDAANTIKQAKQVGVDSTDMVNALTEINADKRNWIMSKMNLKQLLANLKANIANKESESSVLNDINEKIKTKGVEYREVRIFDQTPTEKEIISRVGGGDLTDGSCASAAFAYAANKCGLDVLDFRGGKSLDYFSKRTNLLEITEKVGGIFNFSITGMQILKNVEVGKQYYLVIGQHAAIVRKKSGKYQYLELQSDDDNGWHDLNSYVFGWRFYAKGRSIGFMIDIELLQKDAGFKKMVGYINTPDSEQLKGSNGTIK